MTAHSPHPDRPCRGLWLRPGEPPVCVWPDHYGAPVVFVYRDGITRDVQ